MERSIFLTLLSLFFFFQIFSSAPTFDLDLLCNKLEKYNISNSDCLDFFLRDARVQHATIQELAAISIDVVTANSTAVQEKIASLLKNETNPSAKVPLELCSKNYSEGARILKQAKVDAVAKNFTGSSSELLNYGKYPQNCIDAYAGLEDNGIINPVRGESYGLINLEYIAKSSNDVAEGTV